MSVQINDTLFKKNRIGGVIKVTVTKITPSGNLRVSDGSLLNPDLKKKTSDVWDNTVYYAWSQELEDAHRLQVAQGILSAKLNKLDVFDLNETSVNKLLNLLSEI